MLYSMPKWVMADGEYDEALYLLSVMPMCSHAVSGPSVGLTKANNPL